MLSVGDILYITDIVFIFKEVLERKHAYIISHRTCFKKIEY